MRRMRLFVRSTRGQDLVEYTLLLAGLALTVAGVLAPLAVPTSGIWQSADSTLAIPLATSGAPPSPPPAAPPPAAPVGDGR